MAADDAQTLAEIENKIPIASENSQKLSKNFVIHKNPNNAIRQKQTWQNNYSAQRDQIAQSRPSTGPAGPRNPYQGKKVLPIQKNESDVSKPMFITFDKEKFQEELLIVKQQLNETRLENAGLRTRTLHFEKQLSKYEKIIEDFHSGNPAGIQVQNRQPGRSSESCLQVNLKKQIKELQFDVKQKSTEIEQMKRSIKFTTFQELEIEKKQFGEEVLRLRQMLDELTTQHNKRTEQEQTIKDLSDRNQALKGLVETVRRDNSELVTQLKVLEARNLNLEQASSTISKDARTTHKELVAIKKQLKERELEVTRLKSQEGSAQTSKNPGNSSASHAAPLQKSIPIKSATNNKQQTQKYKQPSHLENKKGASGNDQAKKAQKLKDSNNSSVQSQNENNKNLRKRIAFKQISEVAYEIRFRLINKGMNYSDIPQFIIPEQIAAKGKATYSDMVDVLKGEPFKVVNQQDLDNLSHYLIESDLDGEDVPIQKGKTCDFNNIKEAFMSFIQEYDLNKIKANIEAYHMEIFEILNDHGEMVEKGMTEISNDGIFIGFQDIDLVLQHLGIEISFEAMDLMIAHLFGVSSGNLRALKIREIFDHFYLERISKNRTSTIEEKEHEESYEQGYDLEFDQMKSPSPFKKNSKKSEPNVDIVGYHEVTHNKSKDSRPVSSHNVSQESPLRKSPLKSNVIEDERKPEESSLNLDAIGSEIKNPSEQKKSVQVNQKEEEDVENQYNDDDDDDGEPVDDYLEDEPVNLMVDPEKERVKSMTGQYSSDERIGKEHSPERKQPSPSQSAAVNNKKIQLHEGNTKGNVEQNQLKKESQTNDE